MRWNALKARLKLIGLWSVAEGLLMAMTIGDNCSNYLGKDDVVIISYQTETPEVCLRYY